MKLFQIINLTCHISTCLLYKTAKSIYRTYCLYRWSNCSYFGKTQYTASSHKLLQILIQTNS